MIYLSIKENPSISTNSQVENSKPPLLEEISFSPEVQENEEPQEINETPDSQPNSTPQPPALPEFNDSEDDEE